MKKSFLVFVLTVFLQNSSFAQEAPKLSGIMQGDAPAAILNDKIVAVGESVDGFRVIEVGADYVDCEGRRGVVRLMLPQAQAASKKTSVSGSKPAGATPPSMPVAASSPSTPALSSNQAKAEKYLAKSFDYLKQADAVVKTPLLFERVFDKSIELCEAAETEAQNALRSAVGNDAKAGIANHIEKVRKAKNDIAKEKANFNMRIRSYIAAKQVVAGMTQRDVTSSWGQPLMRNRDGNLEKWVYKDNYGNQKELAFQEGILVSYQ